MKEEYILKLVQIQNQFRFLHWQTTFDAKHKAYGDIYEGLGDLIDDFVEAMMGKYGRPEFPAEFSIMFQDINKLSMQNFIDGICEFLISMTELYMFNNLLQINSIFHFLFIFGASYILLLMFTIIF